ncbi:MAG TPA: ATP-binding protein [Vicinamibacterales bacterium]|nr:ATP-binding protein [Vicinamibacterales bacterium]
MRRSPSAALLLGLLITLATVLAYSWYISRQISGLRRLQTELMDRNRRDSLQLLRIQNDLNQLALAMRDMLDAEEPYPLTAWAAQFERIRLDLDDAIRRQADVAVGRRTPEQTQYLSTSVAQFWDAADRIFDLARAGQEDEARAQIRLSLQARQAALSTTVARLLVQNNETEEQAAQQVQEIYASVQRQVYWFLAVALAAIVATSLYLIRSNRRLFAELAGLSEQRRELTQKLMTTREATLREISRELHDEFGQILTAIGSMLGRAEKQLPADARLRGDLHEIGEIAQAALDNVRGLSQTLHPSILEELGLESTIDWYLSTVGKQLGIEVSYERTGDPGGVGDTTAIHVYRVLQEALSNVARHSGVKRARVRLRSEDGRLTLEVEDRGKGLDPDTARRGLGLVAMRERAELLGGVLEILQPREGGTLVRLSVPQASGETV